jgi:two-component sensor histidine kinase
MKPNSAKRIDNDRINSLSNTHALLSRSHWHGVALGELVRNELAFCTKHNSAVIEGPDVDLTAEATQPVAIVLHELATNAAKYGALSNGHGRVIVRWRRQANGGSGGKLVLEWRETGGPPVAAPSAPGYGTSVIRDLIPYELGGAVDYELAREGARLQVGNTCPMVEHRHSATRYSHQPAIAYCVLKRPHHDPGASPASMDLSSNRAATPRSTASLAAAPP